MKKKKKTIKNAQLEKRTTANIGLLMSNNAMKKKLTV